MKKIFLFLLFSIFLTSIVVALPQDATSGDSLDFNYPTPIDNSSLNVNNSICWQGLCNNPLSYFASIIWNYNQTQPAMDYADANFLRNDGDIGNGDYVWVGDFNMTGIHRYSFSPSSEIPINTGNVSAGNGINMSGSGAGNINWTNPNFITGSDNFYASINGLGTSQVTSYVRSINNSFDLPSTASDCQVTGIVAYVEKKNTNSGNAVVRDYIISLIDGEGNVVGDNKATTDTWTSTDVTITYGSSTDDWNSGMTCDDFNSNSSGLGVSAYTFLDLGGGGQPKIDVTKLIVYYTTSNGWYSTGAIDSIDSYSISPYSYLTTANSTYFNTSGDVKTWGNFYANNGSEKVCTSENGRCNQSIIAIKGAFGDYLYNNETDIFFNSTLLNSTIDQRAGGGSTKHIEGSGFVFPINGDYHKAPFYLANSSTPSNFTGGINTGGNIIFNNNQTGAISAKIGTESDNASIQISPNISNTAPGITFYGEAVPTFGGLAQIRTGDSGSGLNWFQLVVKGVGAIQYIDNEDGGFGDVAGISSINRVITAKSTGANDVLSVQDNSGLCNAQPTTTGLTWSCSSDENLKTNITDTNKNLTSYFEGFRIRDYNVKATGERVTGVIAQEVNQTYPQLVSIGGDGNLSVSTPSPWDYVKVIQELIAENEAQQNKINELEARINALERK